MSHFDNEKVFNATYWSQQLSFWFAGIIVFSSVKGFLSLLTKIVLRFHINNNKQRRTTTCSYPILLFITYLMGIYFISSVLMMQFNLPPEYRFLISSSLRSIEFDYFKRWSDIIFIISSFISFIIINVMYVTHDAKSMIHDFKDVELYTFENGGL
ncbi:Abscisic acid G-protein coupled receptor-domain-containing protein [Cokeromyces recurvatus]|uniref:Abscisic acid G-protein coupled receptor-domain-containing protein n=1 Tax=Cokeromyces recurvatus TaxID=90255 RepID=UPI00221EBB59|nr:Abscisic acid G-protein coupled receptor-domain-containing protein [Cokeromyces recurvatus]KAI7897625.1 Abscisic acid G-protein coupled receptor-domain-containing protein [Cokeromyces recurvatus]